MENELNATKNTWDTQPNPHVDPLPHPIAVNSFSFVLFLFYCGITLVVVFQIGRIIYYRHNLFHYQFLFLLYCLTWGVLRSVFWLLIPWTSTAEMFLQGFGIQVQFWTFTLVVLFYMQMIHKIEKDWNEHRNKCFLFYLIINLLFLLGFLASASLTYFFPLEADAYWISAAGAFFISIMYLALALLLSFFGWRLVYLIMTTPVQIPFLKSKSRVIVLTIILVLTFISRSVRDLLAGFDIGSISLSDPLELALDVQIGVFLMMFIWELIPAVIVIFLFWHIPHTAEPTTFVPAPLSFTTNRGTERRDTYAESSRLIDPPFPTLSHLYSINGGPTALGTGGVGSVGTAPGHSMPNLTSDSYGWSAGTGRGTSKVSTVPPTFQKGGTVFSGYATSSPLLKKDETPLALDPTSSSQ